MVRARAHMKKKIVAKSGRRLKPAAKKTVNRLVRAVAKKLDKRVETKQITLQNDTYFNSSIASTSEFYNVIPNISQNSGDAGRIGQKVRMKYLKVKGICSYEVAVGASNNLPIFVDVFFLTDKIQKSQNMAPHDYKILNNSGVSTAYNGDTLIAQLPFNTEDFKLIKRKRIRLSLNWAPGNSSTGVVEPKAYLQKQFTVKIPVMNRVLDYESSSATLPQNTNIWMCAGFFQYSNTTQLVAPARIQWLSTLYYKDD